MIYFIIAVSSLFIYIYFIVNRIKIISNKMRFKIRYAIYNFILFPSTIAFFYQISFISFRNFSLPTNKLRFVALIILQMIALIVVFFEMKMFYMNKRKKSSYRFEGVSNSKKYYLPIYLSFLIIIYFFI